MIRTVTLAAALALAAPATAATTLADALDGFLLPPPTLAEGLAGFLPPPASRAMAAPRRGAPAAAVDVLDPVLTDLGAPLRYYGLFAEADGVTIPLPGGASVLSLVAPTGRAPEWATVAAGGEVARIAGGDLPVLVGIAGADAAHVRIGEGGSLLVTLFGEPTALDVPVPIPLPATGLLLIAALGGLGTAAWRRTEA